MPCLVDTRGIPSLFWKVTEEMDVGKREGGNERGRRGERENCGGDVKK